MTAPDFPVPAPSVGPTDKPTTDEWRAARGDVHHLIQPIIGQMRLAAHEGDRIHPDQLDYWIDRLYGALAVADAFGDVEARRALAAKHGLGYGTPAPVGGGQSDNG